MWLHRKPLYLDDLLDPEELLREVERGTVRVQSHPFDRCMRVANYTPQAAYENLWTPTQRICRGLIWDAMSRRVWARPLEKFFSFRELPEDSPLNNPNSVVGVSEMLDGTLGIVYDTPGGGRAMATRGSFYGDQARHGTSVLNTRYKSATFLDGYTYLFEIIYPHNRRIVNYGDVDDIYLLGLVHMTTGEYIPAVFVNSWGGPKPQHFGHVSLREAYDLTPVPQRGHVMHYEDGTLVSAPRQEYIEMRKIITGTSERSVWGMMLANKTVDEICAPLPPDMHPWVKAVATRLVGEALAEMMRIKRVFASSPHTDDRRQFAVWALKHPESSLLFMLFDGHSIAEPVWQSLRPSVWARPTSSVDMDGPDCD